MMKIINTKTVIKYRDGRHSNDINELINSDIEGDRAYSFISDGAGSLSIYLDAKMMVDVMGTQDDVLAILDRLLDLKFLVACFGWNDYPVLGCHELSDDGNTGQTYYFRGSREDVVLKCLELGVECERFWS